MGATMNENKPEKIISWAPIVGRWSFSDGKAVYKGTEAESQFPFGICASGFNLSEGSVNVTINLSSKNDCCGRILLGYKSPNDRYFSIGLGGYRCAYVLSEYVPSEGWRGLTVVGNEQNLQINEDYEIEAKVTGQRLRLSVNKIRIFETVLDAPFTGGQVGLYAWGTCEVSFKNMLVSQVPGKVFVVMQFSEPYQQLYSEVIQPVCEKYGLHAYHIGEVFGPGVILQDIASGIVESKIIIAEVTPANQNVFYELGYSHALGKPTILLAEREKQLPFDITGYRCLFYENTIGGKKQVEESLEKHLKAILND